MKPLQTIAIVDDDPDILAITELCLQEFGGLEVVTFNNGKEFLERKSCTPCDILLSDMMMPGLTGLELLAKLQDDGSDKHFLTIFMTAKAQTHEVNAYREAGAIDVITKPFDPMGLSDQINTIWERNAHIIAP